MNTNKLKYFIDINAEEYHQAAREGRFLTSHFLGDFRKSPKLYRMKMSGEIQQTETSAFLIGRAVHSLILEGRGAFEREFIVSDGPINHKTNEVFGRLTKAYKEWAAAQTKPVISGSEFGLMTKFQQSVWTHPIAMDLLDDGIAEQTVRTHYCGEPCQVRVDWFRTNYNGRMAIVDLKTCQSVDWFESDAKRLSYPHQSAFYRDVLAAAGDIDAKAIDCYLIAVEKAEPYRCGVWKLTDAILDSASKANERAIAELQDCRRMNVWPTRLEDLRVLDI